MWTFSITHQTITAPDGRSWPVNFVHNIDPTPRGRYFVTWYDKFSGKGNCVCVLTPIVPDASDRIGLMVHGDDRVYPGEIIASHECRKAWRASGDLDFDVTT